MKPLFGVKPGRSYLPSTIWIAASHLRECDVRIGGEQLAMTLSNRAWSAVAGPPTRTIYASLKVVR